MNFLFWSFLWFGLPGRLLKKVCSDPFSRTFAPKKPTFKPTFQPMSVH